jgi:hypothetical protein
MKESPILTHIEQVAEGKLSPEALAWLQSGFRAFLDHGEPLDQALRLNCVHSRGARYAVNYRKGLRHLRQAAALLPPGGTPWSTALLLAREVETFSRYRWPRLRSRGDPPDCLSPLDRELFGAFRALAGKVPSSSTRLFEILTEA